RSADRHHRPQGHRHVGVRCIDGPLTVAAAITGGARDPDKVLRATPAPPSCAAVPAPKEPSLSPLATRSASAAPGRLQPPRARKARDALHPETTRAGDEDR